MAGWACKVLLAAALLVAVPAWAQAPPGRATIDRWDLNRDGRVSWDEVWESIQRRFVEADTDRSGGLGLDEWMAAQLPGRPPRADRPAPDAQRERDRRTAMFRAIDSNRDNQVTLMEIRPVAESWFRALDANGDGAISADEVPRPTQRPPG
jgi:Ca2+-binding EF-hand superfamily protein